MKNNIKIHYIGQRLLALLLTVPMALTFSSCSSRADLNGKSSSDLIGIGTVADNTLLDELIREGKLLCVDGLDVVTAADRLENYMAITERISKLKYEGVESLTPLTEDQKKLAITLSLDDVEALIDAANYNGNDLIELENKINAIKTLDFLRNYCEEWVHKNGEEISIFYMLASVKACVADACNIPTSEYDSIVIPPSPSSAATGPTDYYINVGDTKYVIPASATEIYDTVDYIYEVQGSTLTPKTEYATYKKAINYAKTTTAAGANISNGNILTPKNDADYIEKHYAGK